MLGCCLHTSYGGLSRIQSLFSPSLSEQFIRRSRRDFLEANQTSREKIFALVTLTTFWGPCWVPCSYEMRSSQRAKKRCVYKETLKAGSHEQRKCKRKYKQTHVCQPQRKCKYESRHKKWKIFHFLALALTLVFAFHTCELGQCKGKRTQDEKYSFHAYTVQTKMAFSSVIFNLVPRLLVSRLLAEIHMRISFCLQFNLVPPISYTNDQHPRLVNRLFSAH